MAWRELHPPSGQLPWTALSKRGHLLFRPFSRRSVAVQLPGRFLREAMWTSSGSMSAISLQRRNLRSSHRRVLWYRNNTHISMHLSHWKIRETLWTGWRRLQTSTNKTWDLFHLKRVTTIGTEVMHPYGLFNNLDNYFIISVEYDGCLVAVRHPQSDKVEFLSTKICGPHGRCVSASEDRDSGNLVKPGEFRCECDLGYSGEVCHISMFLFNIRLRLHLRMEKNYIK